MKLLILSLATLFAVQIVKAQTNTLTGSVQDESGRLLHYVYVGDTKYGDAAFTDSTGTFTIPLHPDSKLHFQLEGHRDTLISAEKVNSDQQVVLKSFVKAPAGTTPISMRTTVNEEGFLTPARRVNVAGSRYLFETFVHGFFTDTLNRQVYSPYFQFEYEKMSGFLLMTTDHKNVLKIDRDIVKSFTLYDNTDKRFDFETVPVIDKGHYLQVLAKGSKYGIYKRIKTTFYPQEIAHTAGGDKGNDQDIYVDESEYYVYNAESKQVQKIALKKKAIKSAFPKEEAKVNKFITETQGDVNDDYLSKFGSYINQ